MLPTPQGGERPWHVVETVPGPPDGEVVHQFYTEDGARHAALWLADKAALLPPDP